MPDDKLDFTVQGPYSAKELSEILRKIGFKGNGGSEMMTVEELIKEDELIVALAKKTAVKNGLDEKKLIYDGIYEKYLEKYLETSPRILWILKEAPETNGVYGWHLGDIDENNKALQKKGATLRQVCLISYALLNKCSYEDAVKVNDKDLAEARQRVGQINVCKIKTTSGKESAPDLTPEYEIWKKVLDAQIIAYRPEIIICGNTLQYFSNDNNYFATTRNDKKILESIIPNKSNKFCYYSEKDRLYINIHHPSDFNVNWKECINEMVKVVSDWDKNRKKENND